MVTTAGLLEAYYDCRKNKRKTASALVYEMDYESKLIALRDRINTQTYKPGKSICFVVTRPRHREVFAASFEDRIIHHYIALRLEPLFEQVFCPYTYNCRKGKGQLYGINTLKSQLIECSENYTRDCYIMKLDLSGFFMSINKDILAEKIDRFVCERYTGKEGVSPDIWQAYPGEDKEDLRRLCRIVIYHEPEKNCERHSPAKYWDYLPANKSLFTNGEGLGIAIGNLFAQLFANFLLNELDWYLEELGFKYHGRYVDDFYLIDPDKSKLLHAIQPIREKLASLGLKLNEKKTYIQHYTKGVEFTGSVVKPHRSYTCNHTVTNFVAAIRRLNRAKDVRQAEHAVCSINSYLGLLIHNNEYNTRKKVLGMIEPKAFEYIYIKGRYKIVALKNKYKKRLTTYRRIRDGDY
jgi:hypothetical protein